MASSEDNARLIVLSILDDELPDVTSAVRITLASRIVDSLAEVELIPED